MFKGPVFSVGDKIEANYQNEGTWHPGKIAEVDDSNGVANATFKIMYNDGDVEVGVEKGSIHLLED